MARYSIQYTVDLVPRLLYHWNSFSVDNLRDWEREQYTVYIQIKTRTSTHQRYISCIHLHK